MIILGLNAYHGDSSACLFVNSKMVAAAEEERFTRVKHYAGLPIKAIEFCLEFAEITIDKVDVIAVNQDPRARLFSKAVYGFKNFTFTSASNHFRRKLQRINIKSELANYFDCSLNQVSFAQIEHHIAHLASAFYVSGFSESACISIDGFGDFASTMMGVGRMQGIKVKDVTTFPHSAGIFYQAFTQLLGFNNYGDEYKVMGLAPYGEETYLDQLRNVIWVERGKIRLNLAYFKHHRGEVKFVWDGGSPQCGALYSRKMEQVFGPVRLRNGNLDQWHFDLAKSVQRRYEEVFFELLNYMAKYTNSRNICIAGGCGANSVANGKIQQNTQFENVYVQSAAGDAGGAIGAALVAMKNHGSALETGRHDHAYFGPRFSDQQIAMVLDEYEDNFSTGGISRELLSDSRLFERVAKKISEGHVIGWFQGRMEWGPRALGNRSILADPRRSDMKDILNKKIKKRESFRPFAPSVMAEHASEWFESFSPVPFMMQVYKIREEKQTSIPAVCHVDGSGRLQTVEASVNPRYHSLIARFYELTGVPMLLNTSFNENEPVVCKPSEAIECFLRTDMDVLVLGNYILTRAY